MSVINLRFISATQYSAASRTRRFQQRLVVAFFATIGIAAAAQAQSSADGFNPGVNGPVSAVLVQPDGKVLIGGAFTMLGGGGSGTTSRSYIGRLNLDGSLDTSFNPGANGDVTALALQPDGKILVGGQFTTLGGGGTGTSTRNHIGRLNADGSLDPSFDPGANDGILALAVQPDGKIVAGGRFSTLGGGGTGSYVRNRVGRLSADGTLDAAFNPGANGDVIALRVQPNLRILVGGAFTTLGGGGTGTTIRNHVGRLSADGSIDASFNPGANANVETVALQADGSIVIGGLFTTLGGGGTGTTPRHFLGRLGPDGSLDSAFDPGADGGVSVVSVQADGRTLVGGSFAALGGGSGTTPRHHIGRVNFDGSLDAGFDPGADGDVLSVVVQSDGQVIIAGAFTTLGGGGTGAATRNRLARIDAGGWLDTDFNPGADGGFVEALALQADGKVLVGGNFTTLGGGGTVPRSHIGRLNPDGSLDASFDPGTDRQVNALAVQPDGKILVGGDFFSTLGGLPRYSLGRLNADGSADASFNPGSDGFVYALAVQPDGRILVGGSFGSLGGGGFGTTPRHNIGRLNPDGSLDVGFDPSANGLVHTLAVQADGKILIGGAFTTLGGSETLVVRNRIARLNADGSVDSSFDPGANGTVSSLTIQADGAILLGGDFTTLGGGGTGMTTRNRIGRLQADGALDASFNPGASDGVYAISTHADGKILVGGNFVMLGGGTGTTARLRIGRLNLDGALDSTFNPGADQRVDALVGLADGKILVGGAFIGLGGAARNFIGRLTNTEPAVQRLDVTGSGGIVTWSRSGAEPELGRATFEVSTDGETFAPLGSASRGAGGWLLSNQSLPVQQNLFIRARGYYAHGQAGGVSGSIVESIRNAYVSCPTISTTSLPPGIAGIPYAAALNSSGAIGVVAFGVTGVLPSGVAVGAAGLSGTPLQFGSFPITLTATDTLSGCAAAPQNVTLNVGEPTIILSSTTFPAGTAGIAYPATTITQSGGIGAATFAVTSGALPNGLTLSSAGVVSGTSVVFGVFNFTVTATDVNGSTGSRAYAVTIGEPTITLSQTTFPVGTQNVAYVTTTITQTGGIGAATLAVTGGALPNGLGLSTGGALSGTPTATGTFNFTVTATDVNGSTGSRAYALMVRPQTAPTLTMQPGSQTVPEGSAVTFSVAADGAPIPALRWQVSADGGASWADLLDTTLYSGSATASLTLTGAPTVLTGRQFRAVATNSVGTATSNPAVLVVSEQVLSRAGDFDGDRKDDIAVFRPTTGAWYVVNSGTGAPSGFFWGGGLDVPVPGDYDGDGKTDVAIFRPSNGTWFIVNSSTGAPWGFAWGNGVDVPVPGDYDGDGKTDVAVFRPSNGTWFIVNSSTGIPWGFQWGNGADRPVPGDYDGDGKTDIAVFRPSNGTWYVMNSRTGAPTGFALGNALDVPVPGDYDGDGKTDVAVFRPSTGMWHIVHSSTGTTIDFHWGNGMDVPVAGDYDGDGKTDIAVFRPGEGAWYIMNSSTGFPTGILWGNGADSTL